MKKKLLTITYFFIIILCIFQTVFGMSLTKLSVHKLVEHIIENRIDLTKLKDYPEEIQSIIFDELVEQKTSLMQKWIKLQTVPATNLDPDLPWIYLPINVSNTTAFAISPDKQTLYVGKDDRIYIYTKNTPDQWTHSQTFSESEALRLYPHHYLNPDSRYHPNPILSITFSPDGKTVASSSISNFVNIYTKIKIVSEFWAITEIIDCSDEGCSDGYAESVAFSPDGKTLAIGTSAHDKIKIYTQNDLGLWNLSQTLESDKISHLTFSPDGQFLVASSSDCGDVGFFIKNSGGCWTLLQSFDFKYVTEISNIAFSHDSQRLAVARKQASLFDSKYGCLDIYTKGSDMHWKLSYGFGIGDANIKDLAFSHDGMSLFILLDSGEIKSCSFENFESLTSLSEYLKSL